MEPRNRQDMYNSCHLITHFQLRIQICFISQHDCFKRSSFHSTGLLQNTCKFLLHIDQELPICRMTLRLLLYLSFLHHIIDPLAAIVCFTVKLSRIRGTLHLFQFSGHQNKTSCQKFINITVNAMILFLF